MKREWLRDEPMSQSTTRTEEEVTIEQTNNDEEWPGSRIVDLRERNLTN